MCIKKRACYRCVEAFAPDCLQCLEGCGCGPDEEQQEAWGDLKKRDGANEVEMSSVDMRY